MAAKRWKGGAAATADVWTLTVGGTAANNQVYTVTIGYRSIAYTASGTDTNNSIAQALQTALAASGYGEFLEYAWTVSTNAITATAKTAGIPGVISGAATGTGTLSAVNTTPSTGPNDVSVAVNWSTGTLPGATDDVYFDHTSIDGLWNIQHFNGVAFNSLTISSTFEQGSQGNGTLGLPEINSLGTAYVEYRQQFYQCAPTTCTVGDGQGTGSGRIKLDFGTANTTLVVHGTGAPLDTDLEALLIRGGGASASASITNGASVAFAPFGDDTAALATLNTSAGTGGAPSVRTGGGCTLTTLNMDAGTLYLQNAPATINQEGGTLTVLSGNVTTWNAYAGTPAYLGIGTIAMLTSWTPIDFSQDPRDRTVTNATFYPGGGFIDPDATVTWTNAFLVEAQAADVSLNWGRNRHIALV